MEVVGDDSKPNDVLTNITLQDAQRNPDVIMSTLNILGHFARVLIGCGATNSVSSHTFAQVTQPHPMPPGFELEVCYA